MLGLGLDFDGRAFAHDILDGDLDELVEGVKLLPDEPLLDKIRVNDQPASGLPLGCAEWLLVLLLSCNDDLKIQPFKM